MIFRGLTMLNPYLLNDGFSPKIKILFIQLIVHNHMGKVNSCFNLVEKY